MPKVRIKPYKKGDKFVVYIPDSIDENTLKWINSQKFLSPSVVDVLQNHVQRTLKLSSEYESVGGIIKNENS